MTKQFSELQQHRLEHQPRLPKVFTGEQFTLRAGAKTTAMGNESDIQELFPQLYGQPIIEFVVGGVAPPIRPLKIGAVLSGGQAAGGHNVIAGLFDYMQTMHAESILYGFLDGPHGVFSNRYLQLDKDLINQYRNQGGFDIIGSGRHKIETPDQFAASKENCEKLGLDGLVVIGGDDSNTNAAVLAEYFKKTGCTTVVCGVPKTIDGDLKNDLIEISFGFDTATKTYAELIGNIAIDAKSTKKYYHFVRLMGRSASHIALECALQTCPNVCLIGEEAQAKKQTLKEIAYSLCDTICERAAAGKNFGIVLVPEGLIEFVPQVGGLIKELNDVLSKEHMEEEEVVSRLSATNTEVFLSLPALIRAQLLLDRDPHGNVQVSRIETEQLLVHMCIDELAIRAQDGRYCGKFMTQSHFFGYEGRSCLPSNFDSNYCYSLGYTAGVAVSRGLTGYMAVLRGLTKPPEEWQPAAAPLTSMMNVERRRGTNKPVIQKALVELDGVPFQCLAAVRSLWAMHDCYRNPGPIQFSGAGADDVNFVLRYTTGSQPDLVHTAAAACYETNGYDGPVSTLTATALEKERQQSLPEVPRVFGGASCGHSGSFKLRTGATPPNKPDAAARLPSISNLPSVLFVPRAASDEPLPLRAGQRLGIVFCGRQTPGGHNLICGLVHFAETQLKDATVLGFKNGTLGLFEGEHIEIKSLSQIRSYLNRGGYDLVGRSVDMLRTPTQLQKVAATCVKLRLDGLVLVGGPTTNQDAATVAEYFSGQKVATVVVGVNCNVDGDLKDNSIETPVGFDTATKVYSQLIGNIETDALSAKKYYYFIRLMGRAPSHITLECALQTRPNLVLIGEEAADKKQSISDIVGVIADAICARAKIGKNYGVILLPEGLISHLPVFQQLINEINALFKSDEDGSFKQAAAQLTRRESAAVIKRLTPWSGGLFTILPDQVQRELLLDRESGGSVQLSQVASERLLAHLVGQELDERKKAGKYKGGFSPICHFFGYQARCSMPSEYDCALSFVLGNTAGALAVSGCTGYLATVQNTTDSVEHWQPGGVPLASLVNCHSAGVVIANGHGSEVDLEGAAYCKLRAVRNEWLLGDCYTNPGPIQFHGPTMLRRNATLELEHKQRTQTRSEIAKLCGEIQDHCRANITDAGLDATLLQLESLRKIVGRMVT